MRTLIGHEYEVRVEEIERGTLNGWFRAKYLTPHAKEMGWLWEIDDPKFARLRIEEVSIVEVRASKQIGKRKKKAPGFTSIDLADSMMRGNAGA